MLTVWVDKASAMFSDLSRDLRGVTPVEYGIVLGMATIVIATTAIGATDISITGMFARFGAVLAAAF